MFDTFKDRLLFVIGNVPFTRWAKERGIEPSTVNEWVNKGRVPRAAGMKRLVDSTRIPEEWWLHGNEPYQSAQPAISKESTSTLSEPPMAYMARVGVENEPQSGEAIDGGLLDSCHAACRKVYGDAFDGVPASVQLGYAVDLYNLLVKMSAQKGGLSEMKRLEVNGLVDQLNVFIRLGWPRKFPPPPIVPWAF